MEYKELAEMCRFLSDTPSYTAFHNKTERKSICDACGGGLCYEKVEDANWCMYEALQRAATAIADLLARLEAAEARCDTRKRIVAEYQDTIIPAYRARAEKAESVARDLCDDFTDFVTGVVYNAAPYCANCRPECVNTYGWCNGDNSVCRGFLPKAARGQKEE